MIPLKINNSKKAAVKSGKWSNPGASFYDKLLDAFDSKFGACETVPSNKELKEMNDWTDFLKEAYLIAPVKDIKNSPYGKTPYSRSGCKYPHHVIRNGELVLSIPGVKAAYSRAKQQGVYNGELKNHLDEHMKELDLLNKDGVHYEEMINNNFIDIESFLIEKTNIDLSSDINYLMEKSHGKLKYCYRIGFDVNTGKQVAIQFELDPRKITGVGDINNVQYALDKTNNNSDPNKIREIGLDITKRNITSKGYIDFTTEKLRVDRIFYRNGGAIQSVTIIPLFSKIVVEAMNSTSRLLSQRDNKKITSRELFDTKEFQDNLVSRLKVHSDKFESYTTGEYSGDGKYKTTKLLWDRDMLLSYKYTPVLRGYTKRGREEDLVDIQNYIKNDLNNKFESTFNGDIDIISSILSKSYFHGESYDTISLPYATDTDRMMINHDEDSYIECVIDNIVDGVYDIHGGLHDLPVIKRYQNIDESHLYRSLNGKDVLGGENPNHKEALNFLYELKRITEACISNYTDDISYDHYLNKLKYINNDISLIESDNYQAGMINKYLESNAIEKLIKELNDFNKVSSNNIIQESLDWIDRFVHDEEFRESSYDVMINLSDPNQLMVWMNSNIKYGWRSPDNGKLHDGSNENDGIHFFKYYRLQAPSQLIKSKVGVCWDQCELERRWFGKHGIEHGVFYIELQDGRSQPTHTFLTYKLYDRYWWFEHSWADQAGIHEYNDLRSLIIDVVLKHQNANNDKTSPIYVSWLQEPPVYNITCGQFIEYAHKQKQLNVNELPLTFYESYNEKYTMNTLPDIMYFSSKNKHEKLIGNNGKLFLSPYIGISSIFIIRIMDTVANHYKSINGKLPKRISCNTSYKEWENGTSRNLNKPLDFVHITHNIPSITDKLTGTSSGYIHVVDVSGIKDKLQLFHTNDPDRELIYTGTQPLKPIKIIPHTINWELKFDQNNVNIHGIGICESYDPPLPYDQLPDHLKDDSIHSWRAKTGIELIHKEPSLEELNRIKYLKEAEDGEITIEDDSENTDDGPPPLPEEETSQETETQSTNNEEDGLPELVDPSTTNSTEEVEAEQNESDNTSEEDKTVNNDDTTQDVSNEEPEVSEEPKQESLPKQTDKVESSKNGVRRKKLYIAFIEWCKEFNPKNSFGSIFDKDIFHVTYPFIPEEMRYFYRLANPMLCVLAGDLTFFPVAELRKINSKNSQLDKMMIFAATPNDLRVFNKKDKKVYRATEENGAIKLAEQLGETYDLYIQNMINKGDILNGPIEESVDFSIFW